jgi:glycine amidinotransferase
VTISAFFVGECMDKKCLEKPCPVNSHNEWDPLEEVIVGRLEYAMMPSWDVIERFASPPGDLDCPELEPDAPFPADIVTRAQASLDGFIAILHAEGVTVRRPDVAEYQQNAYATPSWGVNSGFCSANPRDGIIVIGDEIIETPMADRSRYFETWPYRTLLKEYFEAGARWSAAPKPQLLDAQFDTDYQQKHNPDGENRYVLTEFEPTFDAADFVRCGRDIFGQLSHATNRLGFAWLQRHLGDRYRVHQLHNLSPRAIHIDTTFMPLAPGKALISPDYLDCHRLPDILKTWELLIAPEPVPYISRPRTMSNWISINTLMLDEERIIVEKRQEPLIRQLKKWGFKPIPCDFEAYYPFYGGFHCATLDIRRCGGLQSYF